MAETMEAVEPGANEADFSGVDRARVIEALARVMPPGSLLYDQEDLRPYECDGLAAYRQVPMVVALPETEAQAAEILKACSELRVPVVARGAGTGLSGGALPHAHGVVLSLARFKQILRLDPVARLAVVQPGCATWRSRRRPPATVSTTRRILLADRLHHRRQCGRELRRRACLKYGLTVHNVLRVRGLTMAGEVVEFGSHALDAPGYDLLALVHGSEGMLAVVTGSASKLTPSPARAMRDGLFRRCRDRGQRGRRSDCRGHHSGRP